MSKNYKHSKNYLGHLKDASKGVKVFNFKLNDPEYVLERCINIPLKGFHYRIEKENFIFTQLSADVYNQLYEFLRNSIPQSEVRYFVIRQFELFHFHLNRSIEEFDVSGISIPLIYQSKEYTILVNIQSSKGPINIKVYKRS